MLSFIIYLHWHYCYYCCCCYWCCYCWQSARTKCYWYNILSLLFDAMDPGTEDKNQKIIYWKTARHFPFSPRSSPEAGAGTIWRWKIDDVKIPFNYGSHVCRRFRRQRRRGMFCLQIGDVSKTKNKSKCTWWNSICGGARWWLLLYRSWWGLFMSYVLYVEFFQWWSMEF